MPRVRDVHDTVFDSSHSGRRKSEPGRSLGESTELLGFDGGTRETRECSFHPVRRILFARSSHEIAAQTARETAPSDRR